MSSYYGASYDRFMFRTDDSKTQKIKSAYWTTKQAMIKKFKRKEDENIVASDSDLDSKLELFKSVQKTCRELMNILVRYQDTLCYLSQSESEMGRFLKRHSLEDKTQAGKIMSAAGKALSHSAQQRLLLRAPLDRVFQEVKTFRLRAISDTVTTLKRMEAARTEYRGALLWMKHVSEELDPDTFKQLEKFRNVQTQVRKTKNSFDRLKVDSMQKVDLLSASRCNMLSHVLAVYQNSLLTFLEKTSRTMVAVAECFRGYQYYEFSVLKQLRPESKRLAGLTDSTFNEQEDDTNPSNESTETSYRTANEELDRRLDEIFQANESGVDRAEDVFNCPTDPVDRPQNLLSETDEKVPVEHRDLLMELFGPRSSSPPPLSSCSGPKSNDSNLVPPQSEFEAHWESIFGPQTTGLPQSAPSSGAVVSDRIQHTGSSALPSHLWDQREQLDRAIGMAKESRDSAVNKPTGGFKAPVSQPSDLDSWMKLFSDLGQIGNPDSLSKQDGQITDA